MDRQANNHPLLNPDGPWYTSQRWHGICVRARGIKQSLLEPCPPPQGRSHHSSFQRRNHKSLPGTTFPPRSVFRGDESNSARLGPIDYASKLPICWFEDFNKVPLLTLESLFWGPLPSRKGREVHGGHERMDFGKTDPSVFRCAKKTFYLWFYGEQP